MWKDDKEHGHEIYLWKDGSKRVTVYDMDNFVSEKLYAPADW
jgi:hypothetical protein